MYVLLWSLWLDVSDLDRVRVSCPTTPAGIFHPVVDKVCISCCSELRCAACSCQNSYCQTFPLEKIAEAHAFMEKNTSMGKIVITMP